MRDSRWRVLVQFDLDGEGLGRAWREPRPCGSPGNFTHAVATRFVLAKPDLDPVTFAFEDPLERGQESA